MDGFTVTTLDLSMTNPETGNPLVANLYHVDGIARPLSIAELVMAICLDKATEIEEKIVGRMETLSRMTINLEALTEVQTALTSLMMEKKPRPALEYISDLRSWNPAWGGTEPFNLKLDWYDANGVRKSCPITTYDSLTEFLTTQVGMKLDEKMTTISELVQAVSSRIDELNTTNQKEMIDLQADVAKRDNRYELITNMLKSIGSVNLNAVSNFK